jgi:hypothetical protein
MRNPLPSLVLIGLIALSAAAQSRAENFTLTWSAVDTGGTTAMAGSGFSMTASVAQPSSNSTPLSGGGFSLTGGYWTVPIPNCGTLPGDLTADGLINGQDVQTFVRCFLGGGSNCDCADMNENGATGGDDITRFVGRLLGTQ